MGKMNNQLLLDALKRMVANKISGGPEAKNIIKKINSYSK